MEYPDTKYIQTYIDQTSDGKWLFNTSSCYHSWLLAGPQLVLNKGTLVSSCFSTKVAGLHVC